MFNLISGGNENLFSRLLSYCFLSFIQIRISRRESNSIILEGDIWGSHFFNRNNTVI